MEFLTTPDLGGAARWANGAPSSATPAKKAFTPGQHPDVSVVPGPSPNAPPCSAVPSYPAPHAVHQPPSSAFPHPSAVTPAFPHDASATPRFVSSTPYPPQLDRAGIKSSFQSLFSPNPHATPALLARPTTSGVTPFINGMTTPSLVPPTTAFLPSYPPHMRPNTHERLPASSPNASDPTLTSPFLQAAAKEAVRREFMNMPSYVTTSNPHPTTSPVAPSSERVVPGNHIPSPHRPMQVMTKTGSQAPSPAAMRQSSSSSGDAKVPASLSPQRVPEGNTGSTVPSAKIDPKDARHPVRPPMQPYFMPHPQPPPGMVVMGQHGPMMMAPPPGAFYAPPPGMMMFGGGQPVMQQQGLMSHPQPVAAVRPEGPPVKAETAGERKERIEFEKQELIREFKKKTREAALVRFRQKRRERRFGKLIRYDCRKKLADARPRVKGRFVRLKNEEDEESEGMQVVPDLSHR